jgi:dethiobiotin synthetase
MVPLAGGLLIADLAKRLGLPLLVVARPGLGTVNHTLLTCFAAQQMDLHVKGVIINRFPREPQAAEEYAPHMIGSLAGAPLLGIFPEASGDDRRIVETVCAELRTDPMTKMLLREVAGE